VVNPSKKLEEYKVPKENLSRKEILRELDIRANTIYSNLIYTKNPIKIAICVEGSKDCEIFEKVFNDKNCKVFSSHDKEGVTYLVKHNIYYGNTGYNAFVKNRILGIIDDDFDIYSNKVGTDNIFTTVVHDLDIIMIESEALKEFEEKFIDQKKKNRFLANKNIKDILYEEGMYFGLARFINEKERKYRINFDNLKMDKIKKYIQNQDFPFFDENTVIEILFLDGKNNKNIEKEFRETFKKYLDNRKYYFSKPQNLCQGHDIFCLLLSIFKEKIGKEIALFYDEDALEWHFRDSLYRGFYFKETQLCSNLKKWESKHYKNNQILFIADIYQ
jgi:hypothetical protein